MDTEVMINGKINNVAKESDTQDWHYLRNREILTLSKTIYMHEDVREGL